MASILPRNDRNRQMTNVFDLAKVVGSLKLRQGRFITDRTKRQTTQSYPPYNLCWACTVWMVYTNTHTRFPRAHTAVHTKCNNLLSLSPENHTPTKCLLKRINPCTWRDPHPLLPWKKQSYCRGAADQQAGYRGHHSPQIERIRRRRALHRSGHSRNRILPVTSRSSHLQLHHGQVQEKQQGPQSPLSDVCLTSDYIQITI